MVGSSHTHQDETWDASVKANNVLDAVLNETSPETNIRRANETTVGGELKKQRMLEADSERMKSRILFITNNVSVHEEGSVARKKFIDLQTVFDEVHVLVLESYRKERRETKRIGSKVWVYASSPHFFWQHPLVARAVALEELKFTDGFRPDLVVALDPFESAVAAFFIADEFDRPYQVHIQDDTFLDKAKFISAHKNNKWRLRFMRYVLKRCPSVRVNTDTIKNAITKQYKKLDDVALLPRFFHTKQLLALPVKPETDTFPQFSFTAMSIGDLTAESTLFRALDAVRVLLQTPTIGYVVIGDGPTMQQFRARAAILGIAKQVLFLGAIPDYLEHLRSADVLIVTDTDSLSDDLVIKAAALGVPLIMARTKLREDLFEDGKHAFLCDPENAIEFAQKIHTFINSNALRNQFSVNSREVIRTRIEEDPELYRIAYRDTIERILYVAEAEDAAAAAATETKAAAAAAAPTPAPVVLDGLEMKVPEGMQEPARA